MRSAQTLYAGERTGYVRHHALHPIFSRTSRSVAGFYRHGDLRRHAAGDAPCGLGIRSACPHGVAHRDRWAVRARPAAGVATTAAAAPAVVPARDRHAVREHSVSVADGARGADGRCLAWRRGDGDSSHRHRAGCRRHYPRAAETAVLDRIRSRRVAGDRVRPAPGRRHALGRRPPAVRRGRRRGDRLYLLRTAHRWNAGMAMGGIARVSQVQLLQPFITFALAALFNDETITPQILLFAAAVVATVAISTRTRARQTPV